MVEHSPVELVVKAVQALPPAERDRALGWLVDRGASGWTLDLTRSARATARRGGHAVDQVVGEPHLPASAVFHGLERYASPGGEHQGVLVRMPVDQHARLRAWCEQHHFAMATVVRGLVDRFLDQQSAGESPRG